MGMTQYLIAAALLATAAYVAFRRVVPRQYSTKGRLGWLVSLLQLGVFMAFSFFPYQYLPPEWAWDWLPDGTWNRRVALVLVLAGMLLAFGTMIWFGLRRAFGVEVKGLARTAPPMVRPFRKLSLCRYLVWRSG